MGSSAIPTLTPCLYSVDLEGHTLYAYSMTTETITHLKTAASLTPDQAHQLDQVLSGEVELINTEVYNTLYDYYINNGEMPYGTAKARTGDPDFWIMEQLEALEA